jgi:pimeloyl-ACP methyl ester carboxylesterase
MQTRSGRAQCGDVELFYEDLGDVGAPPVVLIMGVGAQLTMWPDGFCKRLSASGYRVIRFDHRDIGLSTRMHGLIANGSIYRRTLLYHLGRTSNAPYTLVDLADDVAKLLDQLEIDNAHVVGASMGGMIAQILAAKRPQRVNSLAVIMSSTGKPIVSLPRWGLLKLLFEAPAADAPWEKRLDFEVRSIALFNGPHFVPSEQERRRRVIELTERGHYPEGQRRHFDALLGTGSIARRYTRHITAPTVVIHGTKDPMLRPINGRGVARAIPGARFVVIDGMGHDLPEPVWEPIVDALGENFSRGA